MIQNHFLEVVPKLIRYVWLASQFGSQNEPLNQKEHDPPINKYHTKSIEN